jgi:UDP-2,3-diacylglucosamine pyrophosphatase LpxH
LAIVAVSDQHLGAENVDKAAFNRFLDQLQKDPDVTDLVLLGDVVDMWRRDASGVFLENKDTFDLVGVLQTKMQVHYIAGNHDYHVLKLQDHAYPIKFLRDLSLQQNGKNIVFKHGYEFDEMQREHFMESLCHSMSDAKGDRDNNIWAALGRDKGDLGHLFSTIFRRGSMIQHAALLMMNPEERLKDSMNRVEKRALASVQPNDVLIFGHTHRPFVDKGENLANSGSWVTTSPVHNTYVRVENGKPRLFVFEGEEITARFATIK